MVLLTVLGQSSPHYISILLSTVWKDINSGKHLPLIVAETEWTNKLLFMEYPDNSEHGMRSGKIIRPFQDPQFFSGEGTKNLCFWEIEKLKNLIFLWNSLVFEENLDFSETCGCKEVIKVIFRLSANDYTGINHQPS